MALDESGPTGLTALIEQIWARWVEGDDGGFARSGLLQRVAAAETLSGGAPIRELGHAVGAALPQLINEGLIRVRNERVRFSHDLLGDWARLRILVGEDPAPAEELRSRAPSPWWHRAIRLFGQRLLEQAGEDTGRWEGLLRRLDDGSEEGVIVRDLLEGVALAEGGGLLRRVWAVLVANDGLLLRRLLDRFLYIATIPDPRIAEVVGDPAAAARLEHRYRIPFWPYWGAVLTVLQERSADVVRLAPVLEGSESVAFAGLLCAVGKRQPSLFEGVLKPLLAPWQLYFWDQETIAQQIATSPALISWRMRSGPEAEAAREWRRLPHRTALLADVAVEMTLLRPDMGDFFAGIIAEWRCQLSADGEPERLLLLAERLNQANYTETANGFRFDPPDAMRRRHEQELPRLQQTMTLLTFPHQCRQLLDTRSPVAAEALPQLWEAIQAMSRMRPLEATEAGPSPVCVQDSACGGIAVLLTLHRDWLRQDAEKEAWCRSYLQRTLPRPPHRPFDVPEAIGDDHWDAFAAESGVLLLAEM